MWKSSITSAQALRLIGASNIRQFFEPQFHIPDKENPILFHLWRLEETEPMYLECA